MPPTALFRLPVLRSLTELEPAFTALASWIETPENNIRAHTDSALERVFVATPIVQNDEAIGRLLVGYPLRWLHERFEALAWRALWAALAVTLSIMLLGWFWARRIVQPLTAVTDAMERLHDDELTARTCRMATMKSAVWGAPLRKLAADLAETETSTGTADDYQRTDGGVGRRIPPVSRA
ncbi:MAG: hypothetical protein R3F53_15005 [Gammaproteobacteria bacterium]